MFAGVFEVIAQGALGCSWCPGLAFCWPALPHGLLLADMPSLSPIAGVMRRPPVWALRPRRRAGRPFLGRPVFAPIRSLYSCGNTHSMKWAATAPSLAAVHHHEGLPPRSPTATRRAGWSLSSRPPGHTRPRPAPPGPQLAGCWGCAPPPQDAVAGEFPAAGPVFFSPHPGYGFPMQQLLDLAVPNELHIPRLLQGVQIDFGGPQLVPGGG